MNAHIICKAQKTLTESHTNASMHAQTHAHSHAHAHKVYVV